jgi:energy-coupling factor transport system ATP-binding protein
LLVPAAELVMLGLTSLATFALASKVVGRLAETPPRLQLDDAHEHAADLGEPGPVPASCVAVGFRYPGGSTDALTGLNADVAAHQFVAVTGPNGAGKSTFARLLAGATPSTGSIRRPGPVGLGRVGGTTLVFQRPESQVLGVRVRDDVVWGLPVGSDVDVEGVLASVGLGGLGERDTITLSGGQLQRLAVAAALARRPALLISDESTAMLDPTGRERLLSLLRSLPSAAGPTVVHATHRVDEISAADAVVELGSRPVRRFDASRAAIPARTHWFPPAAPLVTMRAVGYVYSAGTPWAHRALRGVDLDIATTDAVLVVGGNGSGKSTLAWLLAGLLTPTEGEALLDGQPIVEQVGRVGLGFQHARLQLLRHTVAGELDGTARGLRSASAALALVGLPPRLAASAIDDLSGGQQRRVALARLLASESPLLVLDEPLAGLDDDARAELVAVLAHLRATRPVALVIVSHDFDELAPIVDRVVALRNGEIAFSEPADAVDAVGAFLAAEDA